MERLHIYYDDDFMFEIDSAILVGTTVTIRVPYSRSDSPQIHAERPIGGAAGNCYVNPFMGYTTKIDGKTTPLSDGIFTEILDRLEKKGGLMPNRVTFSEEVLKLVFDEMTEESGVDVLFHAYLLRAERDCDRIKSVTIMGKGGEMTFEADYFIDATGEAAGVAAAVAAQEHTDFPETDVKKIQALLRKHNAFIGE